MASTRSERRRAARGKIFVRDPGSRKPFKRAIALHAKFVDTLAATAQALPFDRQIALSVLPAYVSRGHGGRHRVKQRQVGSRQFEDRSRYNPRTDTPAAKAGRTPYKHAPGYDVRELVAFADSIVAKTKPDPRAA